LPAMRVRADETDHFHRRMSGGRGGGQPVGKHGSARSLEYRLPGDRRFGQPVQAELVRGHGGEEAGAGTAGSPEEIGILVFAGDDLVACSGDNFDCQDVAAGRAPFPGVPTEAPRENIAAQRNVGAVTYGEGEILFGEPRAERAAPYSGADPGG